MQICKLYETGCSLLRSASVRPFVSTCSLSNCRSVSILRVHNGQLYEFLGRKTWLLCCNRNFYQNREAAFPQDSHTFPKFSQWIKCLLIVQERADGPVHSWPLLGIEGYKRYGLCSRTSTPKTCMWETSPHTPPTTLPWLIFCTFSFGFFLFF